MSVIVGEKVALKKFFSDEFSFSIPRYQRPYSWGKEQCEQLFDDIYDSDRESEYFLGTIILQEVEKEGTSTRYDIIDGQQRITTLQILLACLRDRVEEPDFKDSLQQKIFQKQNIADGIPEKCRLEVKEIQFFNRYIKEKGSTKNVKEAKCDNLPQKNMKCAISVFKDKILDLSQKQIQSLIQHINQRCIVIYISTKEFDDAFKLFTIVNDRGLQLRRIDILKANNLAPAVMSSKYLESYSRKWEEIEEALGSEQFEKLVSFIRTIEIKEKAKDDILKEYEELIFNKKIDKGIKFIDYLDEYKSIYIDTIIERNVLKNDPNEISYKNLISIMQNYLPSTDWIPPLLYAYKKFNDKKFFEFVRALEEKYVSDWITGVTATKRVVNMNALLKKIESESDITNVINSDVMYVDKKKLRNALEQDIYSQVYCRYVLLKLEYLESEQNIERKYSTISVEHVLPQNIKKGSEWMKSFSTEECEYWKDKLANLILLSKRKNSSASNYEFKNKKEKYFKGKISDFGRSLKILNYIQWTPEILKQRQEEIVDEFIKN